MKNDVVLLASDRICVEARHPPRSTSLYQGGILSYQRYSVVNYGGVSTKDEVAQFGIGGARSSSMKHGRGQRQPDLFSHHHRHQENTRPLLGADAEDRHQPVPKIDHCL